MPIATDGGLELATCDEDTRDDCSAIQRAGGLGAQGADDRWAVIRRAGRVEVSCCRVRCTTPGAGPRRTAVDGQRQGAFRRATRQLCAFRAPTTSQDSVCSPRAILVGIRDSPGPRSRPLVGVQTPCPKLPTQRQRQLA